MIWLDWLLRHVFPKTASAFESTRNLAENRITNIQFARTGTVHVSSQQIQMSPDYQENLRKADLIVK